MFEIDDRLTALRRPEIAAEKPSPGTEFFFRIGRVDGGAFLTTITAKGEPVPIDYRATSGAEREVLKALAREGDIRSHGFDWDEAGDLEEGFMIQGKPELLHLLLRCRNVVNAALDPVAVALGGIGRMGLRLDEQAESGSISASLEKTYSVYQIAASEELRRLFATDPVLRRLGLKVEGWRIAASADDLKRIRERLNALGYLLDSVAVPGKKAATRKKVPRRKSRGGRWY